MLISRQIANTEARTNGMLILEVAHISLTRDREIQLSAGPTRSSRQSRSQEGARQDDSPTKITQERDEVWIRVAHAIEYQEEEEEEEAFSVPIPVTRKPQVESDKMPLKEWLSNRILD